MANEPAYGATVADTKDKPSRKDLSTELVVSNASTVSVRSPYDRQIVPFLTPEKFGKLISRARQGQTDEYVVMAGEMEERDPFYYSCLSVRKLAVASLPWTVEATGESSEEVALKEEIEQLLCSAKFRIALVDVLDGIGKGYSCTEIVWDTTTKPWTPSALKWKNPRFFHFDRDTAEQLRVRDLSSLDGMPLLPYKYIVHQPKIRSGLSIASGLARVCAAMHLFKSYGIRDWMVFAEVFGMPIRVGKYPVGAKQEDINTLKQAVRDLGTDAGAVMPITMTIELLRATNSGLGGSDDFFNKMVNAFDRQMAIGILGQASNSDEGGSFAKAKVQDLIRKDLRDFDALQLGATVARDLIGAYCDLNYGPGRPKPHIEIDCSEEEDLKLLADALVPFIDHGLKVESSVISERFRLPVVDGTEGETLYGDIRIKGKPASTDGGDTSDNTDTPNESDAAAIRRMNDMSNLRGPLVDRICQLSQETNNMRHFRRRLADMLMTFQKG